jgi:hypothetical protein
VSNVKSVIVHASRREGFVRRKRQTFHPWPNGQVVTRWTQPGHYTTIQTPKLAAKTLFTALLHAVV